MEKLKDCYRGLTAILELFMGIQEDCDGALTPMGIAIWCNDNGYQLERYTIAGEDVPKIESAQWFEDDKGNITVNRKSLESLDLADLIMFPAKKPAMERCPEVSEQRDRCPEDILREEVENE